MSTGYIDTFVRGVQNRILMSLILNGVALAAVVYTSQTYLNTNTLETSLIVAGSAVLLTIVGVPLTRTITRPTRYIAQAIMHIAPSEQLTPAPNVDEIKFGHELTKTLVRQVYDYATATNATPAGSTIPASFFDQIPVATIGLDENGIITLANTRALSVLQSMNMVGEPFEKHISLAPAEDIGISINDWLANAREKSVTDIKTWEKIAVKSINSDVLGYFDIAVSFNKHSASKIETVITLYDHTSAYSDEIADVSFVAMAVHELRTPVTIMRGYIEAFDEELGTDAKPNTIEYLKKMNASAQDLTSFINNVLNVARINQNQLTLDLTEGNWNEILADSVNNLRNRAEVQGKQIELRMQPNLPLVAVDRVTISEVVTNLIDNAIKYSPDDQARIIIVISKLSPEGLIETTVQDHGVGIPTSVMPHLFSKFSRNHRNQNAIGGTGLGLFLSKAIITAHKGNIWANSRENEGSTFSFTLIPFDKLAKDAQTNNNKSITQTEHGWIKNHSMQRR